MDVGALLKAKGAWEKFKGNHPKFAPFLGAVKQRGISEGTILEMSVTYPEGGTIKTNVRLTGSDMELMETLKSLLG